MSEHDPGELADRREREADELEQRSERLESDVNDVRQDWERKRADENVPGAQPPERESTESTDDDD